jgi:ATP-dependent RNA helicase RhlE
VTFDDFELDSRILSGVHGAGYVVPTPIQEQAIPVILAGHDMLGIAQTGTGKTAAFVLPMLQRLLSGPRGRIRALIIAPTRELAEQTKLQFVALGQDTGLRCATVYGGVGSEHQLQALRRGTEIIVACPGRLLDHMQEGNADLRDLEVVVLDEADRLCDIGFLPDVTRILDRLPAARQTLFFSATMPAEIRRLADRILRDPVTVQVDVAAPARTVSHSLYPVTDPLRKHVLLAMFRELPTGRTLVFTRTKYGASELAALLERSGHSVRALQGDMPQSKRQQTIDGFRRGDFEILVATDIAARGIDVSGVTHVINYDMPDTVDAYTHRIGRTGRASHSGEALTLVAASDGPAIERIEEVLGEKIARRRLSRFDYGHFNPEAALPTAGIAGRIGFNRTGHRSHHVPMRQRRV